MRPDNQVDLEQAQGKNQVTPSKYQAYDFKSILRNPSYAFNDDPTFLNDPNYELRYRIMRDLSSYRQQVRFIEKKVDDPTVYAEGTERIEAAKAILEDALKEINSLLERAMVLSGKDGYTIEHQINAEEENLLEVIKMTNEASLCLEMIKERIKILKCQSLIIS